MQIRVIHETIVPLMRVLYKPPMLLLLTLRYIYISVPSNLQGNHIIPMNAYQTEFTLICISLLDTSVRIYKIVVNPFDGSR